MKKLFPVLSLLLVIILLTSTVGVSAFSVNNSNIPQASASTNVIQVDDCYSLDIVFLVDQSGSMSGDDGNPNDPLGNRFQAPRYAMDWLANNRLGHCPTAIHRIGVISFGSVSKVSLPLTVINPATQEEWDAQRSTLEQQISEERMGTTDPLLAFKDAAKMLENAPDQGVLLRKQVLVLLTDGQPCVESLGCTYGNDQMDHNAYMTSMVDYVNLTFPYSAALLQREEATKEALEIYGSVDGIPEDVRNSLLLDNPVSAEDLSSSVYIWVVAMNSVSQYLRDDGKFWDEITNTHAGDLIDLQENVVDVPKEFNAILSSLEGITPSLLGCGNLAIDPYLSGAVLDVFKPSDSEEYKVEISFDGRMLKNGEGDLEFFGEEQYSTFGAIEHYRFLQPPAGLWLIDALQCDGIEASFTPFTPQVTFLSPSTDIPQYDRGGLDYDPDYPYYIEIKISDSNNLVDLNLDPNYPLDLKAYISIPNVGVVERVFSFKADGVWATNDPLPVAQLGQYTVHIVGKAACTYDPDRPNRCENGEILVVDDESGSYNVASTSPVKMVVTSPDPTEPLTLHAALIPDKLRVLPVDFSVQLQGADGTPIDWHAVLNSDGASAIEAVLSAEGQTETITLTPDPDDYSMFTGSFTELGVLGAQQITITMLGDIKRDQYQLYENPVLFNFERKDPLLNDIRFYYGLLGLITLIILTLIIKLIYDRTNVVLGKLQFINESGPRDFSINRHRRVTVISSGLPHELAIKKLVIRNDGEVGMKRKIAMHVYPLAGKDFTLSLIDNSAPLGISGTWRVMYVWGGVTRTRQQPPRYKSPYQK